MTMETSRLDQVHADKALVLKVKEVFRGALLSALSEARQMTVNMEPRFRDQIMDDLTKQFNPESDWMSEAFSDAFNPIIETIDEEIEHLTDDLAVARRELGIRHAAE